MKKLECIVYEEADNILDYGYEKEMNQILELISH